MDKDRVVEILDEMATMLELRGANVFEVMAYRNGARNLDDWPGELAEAVREGSLTELEGIGKGLARVIEELVRDGRSAAHDEMREQFPVGLLDVMKIPNLGTKKVLALHEDLGVDSVEALERAAKAGEIRALKGFGARSEEKILEGIERWREREARRREERS